MPSSTQSMSYFLDDLWSNLDNSPARQRPAAGAMATAQPAATQPQLEGSRQFTSTPAPTRTQPVSVSETVRQTPAPRARTKEVRFFPKAPRSLEEAGLSADMAGRLILKLLAAGGSATGRRIAAHIRLGFTMVEVVLNSLRREQMVALKGDAIAGDYTYIITQKGLPLAQSLSRECTYFGSAPVTLQQYLDAMKLQSVADQTVRAADLKNAFSDLLLEDDLLKVLGPAINSGRGLFLFGEPGNGKTSIAERIARTFGTAMWIPRALGIDSQIIRVFDPAIHEVAPLESGIGEPQDPSEIDQRWIKIRRPTVVAGGELTMSELEVCEDQNTHICEAPLQLKSNGGVLLIDDFGRQRMPVDELLNRWIVPLEKRYDLLNLPSGKKVRVPFDQLVIFSTNLEPKDLVDDAFLRRIPYKVQVPNPTPTQFHELFRLMCKQIGIAYEQDAVDHLIKNHYTKTGRELRACHPRDLMLQVRNYCLYEEIELQLTRESMDFAVACYFSVLS
ncbi:MAG: AAA family ATPase [Planctomycetota bacterium]|nr:AAA family ATPase [Planctomycetota bacterium]